MNSLTGKLLVFSLILTLPARVARPEANIALAADAVAAENGSTLNESEAVKKDLLKLFELCKSEHYAEAAEYIVYRGTEKNRKWVDVYDYHYLIERREVESVGREIKELLEQSDSYQLVRFFEEREPEGKWRIWETIFQKDGKQGKVIFAFLRIKGHYALGDIDGHLAYLRLIKTER